VRQDLYVSMKRSGIDPEQLKELHRIILTTDGTVTDILEAYLRERMTVVALHHETIASGALPVPDQAVLGVAEEGGEVLKREILLRGEISESCHLYASSLIALFRLPPAVRSGLMEKQKSIGHVLLEQRIPTFKEIVDCHRERAGALAARFAISEHAPLLSRTYVMSIERLPVMVITEKFPEFGR
jgi:chorismate-pyruvate lyase